MIFPWGTARRFNGYSETFKKLFGERVQKITLDAGFTCPNRDGSCGTGGCTFCDNRAFNPSYNHPGKSISRQLEEGVEFHRRRYRRVRKYLAYFQAYSNTYADIETLHEIYTEAINFPGIVGIVVGTRPDCVDTEKLDYFRELSEKIYVIVEYGIESVLDRTLLRVNRGHDVEKTRWALEETASRGVRTGGHMMIGLPGETRSDFLNAADMLSKWPLNNVKYHQLQIINGTAMAREFKDNPTDFMQFTLEDYLLLMVEILERLSPSIVVERIAGEVTPEMNIRDGWGIRYDEVLKAFENLLAEKDSWQGKNYNHHAR